MSRARQHAEAGRLRGPLGTAGYVVALAAMAFLAGRGCSPGPAAQTSGGAAAVLPAPTVTVTVTPPGRSDAAGSPSAPAPTAPDGTSVDPRLPDCKAVKAAGLGPYVAGVDPEYGWYPDTDGDQIVCR